jgi:hypothetical protein
MSGVSRCVDRHGVALRIGDRVSIDCTITAIDEATCFVQVCVRAHDDRAVAVKIPIDYFNAFANQVVKLPEPVGRTDRWG